VCWQMRMQQVFPDAVVVTPPRPAPAPAPEKLSRLERLKKLFPL
jgi:hypothetical protein